VSLWFSSNQLEDVVKGYKQDLAYIHDAGFGGFSTNAAPGLLQLLRQGGIKDGLVVDLGCGSGIWAKELIRAGYNVLGIDYSPSMIELAREKAPEAEFRTGSFLKVKLPGCDAVTSLGECFNYLFDESNGKREFFRFFRRVFDALRPGGLFIFDILGPGHEKEPRRGYREEKDWAIYFEISEDTKRRRLERKIVTFCRVGDLYRKSEETHRLHLYDRSEIAEELRRVGFRVRILRGYGRMRFTGAHVAFLARKP
jgi:SAM-dependent methyltransferase